jgi:hypothetical protein
MTMLWAGARNLHRHLAAATSVRAAQRRRHHLGAAAVVLLALLSADEPSPAAATSLGQASSATARPSSVIDVATTAEFRAAYSTATAGTTISVRPGTYDGGHYRRGMAGTAQAPIVIEGADPARPPVFVGGRDGLQLSDASYVTIRNLVIERAQQNGINIDDAETADTPSHHIVISRVVIRDIPSGNKDGIKLSGVTDFVVEDSTLERWGDSGSAIDMVGCHRGVIRNSTFRHTPGMPVGNGVQTKGGSARITIAGNRFEHAAGRAVQIGGDTGLRFFRPQPPGHTEAAEITVERNVFVGGETPVAFVSSDGGVFRFNTVYLPGKFLLRILQENRGPGFVPSRNGGFTDNLVYYTGNRVVNIGDATAPGSFTFARNWWYRADAPHQSRPELPSVEAGGVYGTDPEFVAAPQDFRTRVDLRQGASAR